MLEKISSWQQQLADVITDPQVLCRQLQITVTDLMASLPAIKQFPLRVPKAFVDRMERGNAQDPLLLQVLPLSQETETPLGYSQDPLNEASVSPVPGLLHKYHNRVLLIVTGACAIHCRYCFRRHYPYEAQVPGLSQWEPALHYIHENKNIDEVILSGGDPLILKDKTLFSFLDQLEKIPHIKTCRIHTRLPMVIPDRMTTALIERLKLSRLQIVFVVHCNHANELDQTVEAAFAKCYGKNITLLNQTVLLKGINDSVNAIFNLSRRLFACGILPYYLHLLDPVAGAAHFKVDEKEAIEIINTVTNQLPGYLVPKLVKEVPGAAAKQVIK